MKNIKTGKVVFLSIVLFFILAIVLFFTGLIQKPLAIHMATIHLLTHHLEHGVMVYKDTDMGYLSKYDDYLIRFQTLDGENVYVRMSPRPFPIIVISDSFDKWLG